MKLQPLRSVEKNSYVALSGGVDSIAVAHHLVTANKLRAALWFNHEDSVAAQEYRVVHEFCRRHRLSLFIGDSSMVDVPHSTSKEKYWSDLRNAWFNKFDAPVITGHNLDDAVEYYLLTALQGEGHYTNYRNKNVCRSYLTTAKDDLLRYAIANSLDWFEDPTNENVDFTYRNRIRHRILPEALKINPGLLNTVKRRVIERTLATETSSHLLD
jgi:tRNA(Ile)-lysidine synthase